MLSDIPYKFKRFLEDTNDFGLCEQIKIERKKNNKETKERRNVVGQYIGIFTTKEFQIDCSFGIHITDNSISFHLLCRSQ